MINAVLTTYLLRVIQRHRTVAVRDDKDMFLWEDLLRSHKRRAEDVGGFVLRMISIISVDMSLTADPDGLVKPFYVRMG